MMFAGQKYQEKIKNRISTPDNTAIGVITLFDFIVLLIVVESIGKAYHFALPHLPSPRIVLYPLFLAIYFINWVIWRRVKRPSSELGAMSRQLAYKLPVGSCFVPLGLAILLWFFVI